MDGTARQKAANKPGHWGPCIWRDAPGAAQAREAPRVCCAAQISGQVVWSQRSAAAESNRDTGGANRTEMPPPAGSPATARSTRHLRGLPPRCLPWRLLARERPRPASPALTTKDALLYWASQYHLFLGQVIVPKHSSYLQSFALPKCSPKANAYKLGHHAS